MNVVLVSKDTLLFEGIANVLIEGGVNAYAIEPPEEEGNKYLEDILMIKKEAGVDLLFSFDYYPQISLAAGALGARYICIITKSYDENIFDNSTLNAWNIFFSADSLKVEKLKDMGQERAFLLPFPCFAGEETFDAFLKNDENNISTLYNEVNVLSPKVQGYLDGFMAVYRQDNRQNDVYKFLSPAAREEMAALIPRDGVKALETMADYYDHNILLPILSNRSSSLFEMVGENEIGSLEEIKKAGIVISVPDRNAGTAASFKEWEAIGEGRFLIASDVTDFSILGDSAPITYSDRFELVRIIKYYLENKKEREEYALKVKGAALSINTVENYVGKIIERLSDE